MLRWFRSFFPGLRLKSYRQLYREWCVCHEANDLLVSEKLRLTREVSELRSQLMNVRVCQGREGRAGWEVSAFIPQEVVLKLRGLPPKGVAAFCRQVADVLVERAIQGLTYVDSQGKVCALVFAPLNMNAAPKAPDFVQALYDDGGKYKLSEKAWFQETEEQRLRRL